MRSMLYEPWMDGEQNSNKTALAQRDKGNHRDAAASGVQSAIALRRNATTFRRSTTTLRLRQLRADARRAFREQSPFTVDRPIHRVTSPSIRFAKGKPASGNGKEMESRRRLFGSGISNSSSSSSDGSKCLHKTNELPMCFRPLRFTTTGVNLSVNYGRRTPTHIRPGLDAYAVLPQRFSQPQFGERRPLLENLLSAPI